MDKRIRIVLLLVGVAVVLGIVRVGIAVATKPDDQKLIEAALAESVKASKEGRPGGVMDFLSDRLKINNTDPGSRTQIANFIRDSRPDVVVSNHRAVITGDEARIVSPVDVQMNFLGQMQNRHLSEVTLTFRKEEATEYLVIPTTKWRLVDVQIPDASVYEFLQ